jgi:hypothetical protein
MACNHPNPIGYLFCSSCGQALENQRCVCGFVCAVDAFYCGRCGRSLTQQTKENEQPASAVKRRYDLELAMQLAGITPKKSENEKKAIEAVQENIKPTLTVLKKVGAKT